MQGKNHLYFFVDQLGRSLFRNGQLVQTSTTPRPLEFTPDGWRDIEVSIQRNQKYFALERDFTIPLEFVEDGAHILKDLYYKQGVKAKLSLVILKQQLRLDRDVNGVITGYAYWYRSFYKGDVDFTTFVDAGYKVTVNLMEGGVGKLIRSRENIVYELDLNVPENEYIRWDGILLKQSVNYLNIAVSYTGQSTATHMLPIAFVGKEGEGAGSLTKSQGPTLDTSDYFFKATLPITIQVIGSITVEANSSVQAVILQLRRSDSGANNTLVAQQVWNPNIPNTPLTWNFNLSVTLQPGQLLFFTGDGIGANVNARQLKYTETTVKILFAAAADTTFPRVLPVLYVFKKLMELIGEGAFVANSTLLAQYPNVKITSGDAIRGIAGSKVKTSLSDFFQSINAQFDVGIGVINGEVRLEEKVFFIDYTNPIDLGLVKDLTVRPDLDKMFNRLTIGSPNQDYNGVNGRQEFNTTAEFSSPITEIAKELNLVTAYRTDGYGAEFTRINLEGKSTTDSEGDNDVWMIHTRAIPDGYFGADNNKPVYSLNRDLNPLTTGLLEPNTVFNLFFTPKNALKRVSRFIHSLFYKMDSLKLKFQTISKNRDLVISGIAEIADVPISSLLPPLFTPNILEFEVPTPVDLIEILEQSPIRAFRFEWEGVILMGIPIKVSVRPDDNKAQTITLLSAPSNQLELLIKYFS